MTRVLVELVSKMTEMCMDKTELGSLRAIVLFNPDVKGLKDISRVEQLRERVYASLEEYTRSDNTGLITVTRPSHSRNRKKNLNLKLVECGWLRTW